MSERPKDVLLVEDNPGDVDLILESITSERLRQSIHVARDGEAAKAYLTDLMASQHPRLIILDLNLPRADGRNVLRYLRRDLGLTHIPVIILTSSKDIGDVDATYGLGANCYIRKPVDLESFEGVVRVIEKMWFDAGTTPPRND